MCAFVHVYVCLSVCESMWMLEDTLVLISGTVHFSFETVSPPGLPLIGQTDWLAGQPQAPTCLHFPRLGLHI